MIICSAPKISFSSCRHQNGAVFCSQVREFLLALNLGDLRRTCDHCTQLPTYTWIIRFLQRLAQLEHITFFGSPWWVPKCHLCSARHINGNPIDFIAQSPLVCTQMLNGTCTYRVLYKGNAIQILLDVCSMCRIWGVLQHAHRLCSLQRVSPAAGS